MLTLTKHSGDIFAAPDHTVLIHACNTQGRWGAGIAVSFKKDYPNAFKVYRAHCLSSAEPVQTGTCLLIEPCERGITPKHWIACLFTSAKYGRGKDAPDEILRNTGVALRMCKINSGKFGVPWERTEMVLGRVGVKEGYRGAIEIWDR
ncbi:ADP-ribose 1''-phosphate phosphatase [Xylaria digitata]|nr:ADP-ribose 1''-phosphate phosphatase [Xylaria digitata]